MKKNKLSYPLIACILLISLFLQSCHNSFIPPIPNEKPIKSNLPTESVAEPTTFHTSQEATEHIAINQLIDKELIAEGGHIVTFHEQEENLQADVTIHGTEDSKKPTVCRRLPVYVKKDTPLSQLGELDKEQQKRFIHLHLPTASKEGRVEVYKQGLMGGMRKQGGYGDKKEKKGKEDKEKERKKGEKKRETDSDPSDGDIPDSPGSLSNTSSSDDEADIPDNPSDAMDGYQEVLEIERQLKKKLEEAIRKRGLCLSQVNLIEKHLAEIKKAAKMSRAELRKIKEEVEQKIDFVLRWKWKASSTNTIKCKECKRQMRVDKGMLFHIDDNVFGKGAWHLCDNYGNRIPGTPDYPNLAAIINAHETTTHFVHTCVYCYRDKDIARTEGEYKSSKQKYEELRQDYKQAAGKSNRWAQRARNIKKKKQKQKRNIAAYVAAIESLKEAAQAMEKLRAEAIVDYEAITYGDSEKYKEREDL